jgi:hypothetical protein
MSFRQTQPNFSRGELAPALYGRFDVDAYRSAVRLARNVVVLKFGGMTKRPGTRLVGEVLDGSDDNRLIPFQFSLEQTYALEMGQGYMSPCALGGRVVEDELAITGITNAANAVVEIDFHELVTGDYVNITGVAGEIGNMLNGRTWKVVSVVDADHFSINANTVGLAAFTTATGGITRTDPVPPPTPPVVPPVVPPPAPPEVVYGGGEDWYVSPGNPIP